MRNLLSGPGYEVRVQVLVGQPMFAAAPRDYCDEGVVIVECGEAGITVAVVGNQDTASLQVTLARLRNWAGPLGNEQIEAGIRLIQWR